MRQQIRFHHLSCHFTSHLFWKKFRVSSIVLTLLAYQKGCLDGIVSTIKKQIKIQN